MIRIKTPKSISELKARLYLPRKLFIESAIERFNRLDNDYISRKSNEEVFPVIGNCQIGIELSKYLQSNRDKFYNRVIKIVDIGAADGALTSLFVLKQLYDFGLTNQIELHLVDIAKDALIATKSGKFSIPSKILKKYGFNHYKELKPFIRLLKRSVLHVCNAINLPDALKGADIVVSGFTHHHMNLRDKKRSCKEMMRIARNGAFIAVTDENLSLSHYKEWYEEHESEYNTRGERAPIALESFVSMTSHIAFLGKSFQCKGRYPQNSKQPFHYTFAGMKNG